MTTEELMELKKSSFQRDLKAAISRGDDLMREIAFLYQELSPESLSCDGEASYSMVLFAKKKYERELKRAFRKLGRKVSEEEAYAWSLANPK